MYTAVEDGGIDEYAVDKIAVSTRYVEEEDHMSTPSSSSRGEESSSCEELWTDDDDDTIREHYIVCDRYSLSSRRRHESVSCGFDCWKDQQGRRRSSSSLDDDDEYVSSSLMRRGQLEREALDRLPVRLAKKNLLAVLQQAEGEPRDPGVVEAVKVLAAEYRLLWAPPRDEPAEYSASVALRHATGCWEALTRADFPGSVGRDGSNYTYTLGRMSFGLFSPGDVVVSVDACAATCRHLDVFERQKVVVPDSISGQKRSEMRSYNIQVRFTVEDPRARGLSGTITTRGYCVGSEQRAADAVHRLDVWFVAGDLRPDDFKSDEDKEKWAQLFGVEAQTARQKRSLVTRATLWFVSVALGIQLEPVQPEGVQCYTVGRPITGHVDVLFTDDDLRVTRGNRNSLVIMRRRNNNDKSARSSEKKQ